MSTFSKIKRMLRGEVDARTATQEAMRRLRGAGELRRERALIDELNRQPARLRPEFADLSSAELLAHFRSRNLRQGSPEFFPGFAGSAKVTAESQREVFPNETAQLLSETARIADEHCWPLLGFGEKCFGAEEVKWGRDPLSGFDWPLDFHADINVIRNDGSDARVVWELNRCSHLITLGRAYSITDDEKFSAEFFRQLDGWREQNPVGRGINWNCAMEVALRSMNLLAAFELFLRAPQMDEAALLQLLKMFDQHGAHIRRNLEFSHIATSNHYLADVTGLLWLGVMLPELEDATEWREFGLRELLQELDKQTLPDGADYEASTGYHRLKLELFLYSFVLCHLNGIQIDEAHWSKLRGMIEYLRAYLRPDGRAPLIGDTDSGQLLPIRRRTGDEHDYLLAVGAAVFQEPRFKTSDQNTPEELLWILGAQGVRDYQALRSSENPQSQAFPDAGTYILRQDDLYLLLNTSGSGVKGRGSHGHNDALSIEVSACGTAFIVDPGTYVYTADLPERHLFRSTAYHSTVEVDGVEQNTIDEGAPFLIGDEAQPRVLGWESGPGKDVVIAEHAGYERLPQPVTHRRTVTFYKSQRLWLVADDITGQGEHELAFRFHVAPGLESKVRPDGIIELRDKMSGARLLIVASEANVQNFPVQPEPEPRFSSGDYGARQESVSVCWKLRTALPLTAYFCIVPIASREDEGARLRLALDLI
ncbi:MAG TPA: alginate lyase family protein [Pyrinomonadaceae bacterium]|nr:alginate lyase family protein [Pyrinomonadaceae bacterium]